MDDDGLAAAEAEWWRGFHQREAERDARSRRLWRLNLVALAIVLVGIVVGLTGRWRLSVCFTLVSVAISLVGVWRAMRGISKTLAQLNEFTEKHQPTRPHPDDMP